MPQNKKDKRIAFNRTNIVEAATGLFAEKGLKETTMDDIAKAAEYSKSTLYVYFKSKDEIYDAIVYGYMQHLRESIEEASRLAERFEQCYYRICDALVEAYLRYPLYFESLLGHISIDENDLAENEMLRLIYAEGERLNESLLGIFEKGISEGYLRQDLDILPTVLTLWASLANTIILAHKKEAYIAKRMSMSKAEFLNYSFGLLLEALRRKES